MKGSPNKKVKLESNNNDFTEVFKLCLMHIPFESEFIFRICTLSKKVHAFIKKYFFVFNCRILIDKRSGGWYWYPESGTFKLFVPNKTLRQLQKIKYFKIATLPRKNLMSYSVDFINSLGQQIPSYRTVSKLIKKGQQIKISAILK